ncbi:cyclase family protein, partial [Klebsiella pneumoniae]|nr:cyclase family protein [Klebsiella pneumoniae]
MKIQQIVDLSVSLKGGIPSDPPGFIPEIEYADHKQGAQQMTQSFPGLSRKDLPGQEGWAIEKVNMSTHAGTHIDSPYH